MADWIFWGAAALVALVVAALIARPLLSRRAAAQPRAAHDAQVFRDQLRELDKEIARGVVAPEEAEATKLEISRRLLAADEEARRMAGDRAAPAGLSRALAALLALAAPVAALWLYADLGAPGAADQPLAARGETGRPSQADAEKMMAGQELAPPAGEDAAEFARLVEQLEARLAEAPEDPQGLFLYARSLMNLGRFAEAWPVFDKVIALRGRQADADLYAGKAEGMILAAGGYISPEAEAALLQVLKREPTNPSARYYLGQLHAQDGNPELAGQIWSALVEESPPDAPWVAPIREAMARLGAGGGAPLPGPTAEDMAAASDMPPEDRQAMVADMVNRLASRLESDGGSVDEWKRLIRSYSVLGRQREAQDALTRAREAFAGDPAALAALESDGPAPAPGGAPLPGPTAEQAADAAAMPAEQRAAMIDGMVSRLAERLRTEGGAAEEWLRLITSLAVLGRQDEAQAAYEEARAAFAGDAASLSMLESAIEGGPRGAAAQPAPQQGAAPPLAPGARGPTQADVAAAADMAPEDRQAMIRGMVAQLHDRLRDEGKAGDVNEWGRLMRSYNVMGDAAAVQAAYEEATEIYAGDSIGLAYLKEAALLNGAKPE